MKKDVKNEKNRSEDSVEHKEVLGLLSEEGRRNRKCLHQCRPWRCK